MKSTFTHWANLEATHDDSSMNSNFFYFDLDFKIISSNFQETTERDKTNNINI